MVFCSVCGHTLGETEWQTWILLGENVTDRTLVKAGCVHDSEKRVWQCLCPQCVALRRHEELVELRRDLHQVVDRVKYSLNTMAAILRRLDKFTEGKELL